MVACAALSSIQPPNPLVVPMTTSAQTVEELKGRLLFAVENNQEQLCATTLDELRAAVTNREILEATRVGFHVNNVRRNYLKKWPTLLKKCRDLIKHWQDFVGDERVRPQSGASSANTTPNLVSPSVAKLARSRGITPNTPVNRRVTSTGVQMDRLGAVVSPANGSSYAPRSQVSPTGGTVPLTNGIHKSHSVAADLSRPETPSTEKNGKRKADEPAVSVSSNPIKRTKTTTGTLVSPSTPQSVSAARKAVQSTSALVAELSLPQHMSIDSTIREHEEKVKREHKDDENHGMHTSVSSPNVMSERKKRKYERKQKNASENPIIAENEEKRGSLIVRLNRGGSVASTSGIVAKPEISIPRETSPPPNYGVDEVDSKPKIAASSKKDWSSIIPSMAELKIRAAREEERSKELCQKMYEETKKDPTKVQLIKDYRRPIFMLPYLDTPRGPDFIVHKYKNSLQYYSEDNFIYGSERPTEST